MRKVNAIEGDNDVKAGIDDLLASFNGNNTDDAGAGIDNKEKKVEKKVVKGGKKKGELGKALEEEEEEELEDELDNEDSDDEEDDEEEDEEDDEEGSDDDEEEEGEEDEERGKTVSKKKYDALEEKIDQLVGIVSALKGEKEEKKKEIEPEIDIFDTKEFTDFAEVMDWDDEEAKAMKVFLTNFGKQVHNNAINKIMQETPTLISKTMTEQTNIEKIKTTFFSDHPNLTKIKPYVATLASTIAKDNDSLTMKQVLKKTAEQIYELMPALKNKTGGKKKKVTKDGKSKKPAFGKSSGSRKGAKIASKKTSVADQIGEMLANK